MAVQEEELYLKLNRLKEIISKREWLCYRVIGIENFIYHLKSIKNERSRDRAAVEINKYLDLAIEMVHEEGRLFDKGRRLNPYIENIAVVYEVEAGFILKPYYRPITLLLICLFLLLNLFMDYPAIL